MNVSGDKFRRHVRSDRTTLERILVVVHKFRNAFIRRREGVGRNDKIPFKTNVTVKGEGELELCHAIRNLRMAPYTSLPTGVFLK